MSGAAGLEQRLRAGDRGALARAITLLERGDPEGVALVRALRQTGSAARLIGLTGPPGSGKSSLLAALARRALGSGGQVAAIAVDPTSPLSGGALLGDRVRLEGQGELFFRSLASRGARGGLADAVLGVVDLLGAVGFDWIFIETVGAGQGEVDIAGIADSTVVVLCPGLGDEIQAAKAGLLEVADLLVVNKADRPGADQEAAQLEEIARWAEQRTGWRPPVLVTSARDGTGIDELWQALLEHRQVCGGGERSRRLQRRIRQQLEQALGARLQARVVQELDRPETLPLIEALAAGRLDRGSAQAQLLDRIAPPKSAAAAGFQLDHVAIASPELEPVVELLGELFGLQGGRAELLEAMGVRAVYLQAGPARIEVVAPAGQPSPLKRFLAQRGRALHHVCLAVDDLRAALARLEARGVRLIDRQPRRGSGGAWIAFVHPSSTGGILIELKERDR